VIPDVAAAAPEVSADKLSYTIKLRTDVNFHDGSKMTSDDILATYNKIIFPPSGVLSPRAGAYAAVDSIARQRLTASSSSSSTFRLVRHEPRVPVNFIYSAAKLRRISTVRENIMGTGPFTYVSNTKGQDWVGKKFADYFAKDKNGVSAPVPRRLQGVDHHRRERRGERRAQQAGCDRVPRFHPAAA